MTDPVLVSIVINNYNYGRFLPEAIDSALAQTYPATEVIVVDDGSTDDSHRVLTDYQDRTRVILKENGGQTSALNVGFQACRGSIIIFLDADDRLFPSAADRAAAVFHDPQVVHVHWPLQEIDEQSKVSGRVIPPMALPRGNLREEVVRKGPDGLVWSPTSGNAWRRSFLERTFPLSMIEQRCRTGSAAADARLSIIAPLFGRVETVAEPQGYYRKHSYNDYAVMPFARKLAFDLMIFEEQCEILAAHCRRLGITFDSEASKQGTWLYQLKRATTEMQTVVPRGKTIILIDDETLGIDRSIGFDLIPFLEQAGQYIGPPPDDDTAIRELERLRKQGAHYLVVAWTAFWWLDCYSRLFQFLRSEFPCILTNERLMVFDLRRQSRS